MGLLRLLIATAAVTAFLVSSAEGGGEFSWIPVSNQSSCKGSCMEMEWESERRILATTNYISYGALQANNVPCSRRGASYYNCRPGAEANPYTRSCSAATQCRS
ncbi:rapid alkalinization factor-like [Salvia hispanica]|uniref:rapid alkalinization factor-like n=1 Tax=Salvia hispanica TaxID=49212 RepID=UPI002009A1DC|nr:rapid alkalinization factor-like [Salvia hispanica]